MIALNIKVEQNTFMFFKLMGGIFGLQNTAEKEAERQHVKASALDAIQTKSN